MSRKKFKKRFILLFMYHNVQFIIWSFTFLAKATSGSMVSNAKDLTWTIFKGMKKDPWVCIVSFIGTIGDFGRSRPLRTITLSLSSCMLQKGTLNRSIEEDGSKRLHGDSNDARHRICYSVLNKHTTPNHNTKSWGEFHFFFII